MNAPASPIPHFEIAEQFLLKPHYQLEELAISLRLVAELPKSSRG